MVDRRTNERNPEHEPKTEKSLLHRLRMANGPELDRVIQDSLSTAMASESRQTKCEVILATANSLAGTGRLFELEAFGLKSMALELIAEAEIQTCFNRDFSERYRKLDEDVPREPCGESDAEALRATLDEEFEERRNRIIVDTARQRGEAEIAQLISADREAYARRFEAGRKCLLRRPGDSSGGA